MTKICPMSKVLKMFANRLYPTDFFCLQRLLPLKFLAPEESSTISRKVFNQISDFSFFTINSLKENRRSYGILKLKIVC